MSHGALAKCTIHPDTLWPRGIKSDSAVRLLDPLVLAGAGESLKDTVFARNAFAAVDPAESAASIADQFAEVGARVVAEVAPGFLLIFFDEVPQTYQQVLASLARMRSTTSARWVIPLTMEDARRARRR